MSRSQKRVMAICLVAWLGAGLEKAWAQDKPKEPPKVGWSNSADLSLVVTAGNSAAQTWGFTDELKHVWKNARFEFEGNVVRSDTSDDRFFMVGPGLEFPVGGAPANPPTSSSSLTRPWMSPLTSSAEATNGTSRRHSSGTQAGAGTAMTTPAS